MTQGTKWKELGVTKSKVLQRNQHIKRGSELIWDFVCKIVDDAVKKGYLEDI
jgi:putative hydrolase of HD superfamily